jgi:hypothetical protein
MARGPPRSSRLGVVTQLATAEGPELRGLEDTLSSHCLALPDPGPWGGHGCQGSGSGEFLREAGRLTGLCGWVPVSPCSGSIFTFWALTLGAACSRGLKVQGLSRRQPEKGMWSVGLQVHCALPVHNTCASHLCTTPVPASAPSSFRPGLGNWEAWVHQP